MHPHSYIRPIHHTHRHVFSSVASLGPATQATLSPCASKMDDLNPFRAQRR